MTDLLETTPEDDASDFAAVFRSQQRAIFQLAFALSGDRALAEDATAEVFSKVYRQWNVKRPDDPAAYLRRAVINQVHGRFRRLRIERAHDARRDGDARGERTPEEDTADHDELVRALMVLSPRQRAAVVLRYWEDLPEAEIAALLGTSVGTVKGYLSRGLDRLRPILDRSNRSD